jgi:hypothetical protein
VLLLSLQAAQAQYWQQSVSYQMDVRLDPATHRVSGTQRIVYVNHSPDTLDRVFFHLYWNAFRPGSSMNRRAQALPDGDKRLSDKISALQPGEQGYQRVRRLRQAGQDLSPREDDSILEVPLAHKLLPGDSTVFETEFEAQVPVQTRRSGRDNAEGIAYSMTQWYPKLCEYDAEGWHADPYIGREFHGVWGDYEVFITLDSSYVIGGTGYLQNPQEIGHGYEQPGQPLRRPAGKELRWHFLAPRVHDFAWAADPDYQHDIFRAPGLPELHFFYQPGSISENWKQLQAYTAEAMRRMNRLVGLYPYGQYSVIQGGDGGMEYAMATLITGNRGFGSLLGVTVHEMVHSWFQHVLASDETRYAWMDEGFTSYFEDLLMNEFSTAPQLNPTAGSYLRYFDLLRSGLEEPSTLHSDHFATNQAYLTSAYSKGAVCLHQLRYVVGDEAFFEGMRRYYREWQFRHPDPRAFKRAMEKASGLELDWYMNDWIETTRSIDYGIGGLSASGGGSELLLRNLGTMPMPLDVWVRYRDGSEELFSIPLNLMRGHKSPDQPLPGRLQLMRSAPAWDWVDAEYRLALPRPPAEISQIVLDPSFRLADRDRKNNFYPKAKKEAWEHQGAVPIEKP